MGLNSHLSMNLDSSQVINESNASGTNCHLLVSKSTADNIAYTHSYAINTISTNCVPPVQRNFFSINYPVIRIHYCTPPKMGVYCLYEG